MPSVDGNADGAIVDGPSGGFPPGADGSTPDSAHEWTDCPLIHAKASMASPSVIPVEPAAGGRDTGDR